MSASYTSHQPRGGYRGGYRNGNGNGGPGNNGGYHRQNRSYGGERSSAPAPAPKRVFRVLRGTGDIFTFESPKAYAPLGYGTPSEPRVLRPQDFDTDTPLPIYPDRPAQVISKPLGANFDDTEAQRPNGHLVRPLVSRENKENSPMHRLIKQSRESADELKFGDKLLQDAVAERSAAAKLIAKTDALALSTPQSVKRSRAESYEPEESVKRQRKDFRIKFEGEDSPDVNNDTVKPENVLRMVDRSLVETPEKQGETPQAQARRYQDYYRNSYQRRPQQQPGDGSPAVGSKYQQRYRNDYYNRPPPPPPGYQDQYDYNRYGGGGRPEYAGSRHDYNDRSDYYRQHELENMGAPSVPLGDYHVYESRGYGGGYGGSYNGGGYTDYPPTGPPGPPGGPGGSYGGGHGRSQTTAPNINANTSRYYYRGGNQDYRPGYQDNQNDRQWDSRRDNRDLRY